MPEYARVCQIMSEYANVCQSMPRYARVCQSMPEYTRGCQSMQEYARACQSMPEYARVCQPQKSKIYSNTFHLPPSVALSDHPELSYSKTNFCHRPCRLPVPVPAMLTPKIKNI